MRRDLQVTIFERREHVGGTWVYSDAALDQRRIASSAMYRSVTANASRPFLAYSDDPIPETVPVYPRHFHMAQYLRAFSDRWGVSPAIHFGANVIALEPAGESRWNLQWSDDSGTHAELFDAVAIANGHHDVPSFPAALPGQSEFVGPMLHSRNYKTPRNPEDLTGRRVLVIGIGNSACDIATDLAMEAEQVFLSTRSGGWMFPRWLEGRPVDQVDFECRFHQWTRPSWLEKLAEPMMMRAVRRRYFGIDRGVIRWGLDPAFGPYEAHAAVNEHFLPAIGNGSVIVKNDVAAWGKRTVHFADGSFEQIDAVVFATGYRISFPFLAGHLLPTNTATNSVNLYRQILSPHLPPTLAFIGLVQPQTGFMPVIEMQARWTAALWSGAIHPPCEEEMNEAIARDRRSRSSMYVDRPRHTIEVEWPGYTDELARELGAMASWWNSGVLREYLFEPIHAAQYRLRGPGANPDLAREILRRLAHNRRRECFNKP